MNNEPLKWAEVDEISHGLDDNRYPTTDDLAGREYTFYFADDELVMIYIFHDKSSLTWETLEGQGSGEKCQEEYEAIGVAPDIYLVSYFRKHEPLVSVSIVLDLVTDRATVLIGTMPTLAQARTDLITRMKQGFDLSPVKVEFRHANVNPENPDAPVVPHERTMDLIGKRIKYIYGDGGIYEHIYLNEHFYTWHCLAGPEQGLADTEKCDYLRISDDVYLFSWHEKTVPTLGVVLVNTKVMRSNGIIFGIDTGTGAPVHFGVGARGEIINFTDSDS